MSAINNPGVTSVGLSLPSIFTVSGSPVTGTGTLTATLAVAFANQVFAGPASGLDAAPTFRALVEADIPSLSGTYLPLAGGTMSGAITFSGTQLGTYSLGGTPTLASDLTVTAGKFVNVATNSATVPPTITWTAVTYANSWVDFGTPYIAAGYYKDALGFVHLRGLSKDGTPGATMFTLPTGYRPAATVFQSNITNGTVASAILISSAGAVSCNSGGNGSISLDGIIFYAEG